MEQHFSAASCETVCQPKVVSGRYASQACNFPIYFQTDSLSAERSAASCSALYAGNHLDRIVEHVAAMLQDGGLALCQDRIALRHLPVADNEPQLLAATCCALCDQALHRSALLKATSMVVCCTSDCKVGLAPLGGADCVRSWLPGHVGHAGCADASRTQVQEGCPLEPYAAPRRRGEPSKRRTKHDGRAGERWLSSNSSVTNANGCGGATQFGTRRSKQTTR